MSNQLMPRPRDGMRIVEGREPLAPNLPAKVRRAIDRESAWGLVNAARAQAAGFVAEARVEAAELATERTMLGLDRVRRVGAAIAQADPIEAEEVNGLVADFLLVSRSVIRRLPREW